MIRKLVIIVMSLIVILNAKAQNIPVYLPKDSLVGWYPFNGNSNDESGKGHHLNNTTAVLETDRHGNKNNGYSLSNGGRLSYFGKSITGGEAFTYSFWMKTNKNLNDYPDGIFSESGVNESGHETGIWFFFEPNTKDFGIVNPGISYAGILRKNFPYIDEWHHVVVQGPVDYKIFVDGKLFTTGSSNYKKFADSCLFHIGGFQGSVDDFSIHNRILTSDEIQALYKNSAPIIELPSNLPKDGLVGWWPFNGNANDESGNENHGTVNGAKLTLDRNGKENSAYSFNGSSSFIEVNESSTLKFQKNNSISISLFAKFDVNTNSTLLSKQAIHGVDQIGWNLSFENNQWYNNSLYLLVKNGINSSQGYVTSKIHEFIDQKWHHFIFTFDNNLGMIYGDGKLLFKDTTASTIIGDNLSSMTFGKANWSEANFFNGQLDDIAIYNRALKQTEIELLYNGCPKKAISSVFDNPIYTTSPALTLNAIPSGGEFNGMGVKDGKFYPNNAKLGLNTINYKFSLSKDCSDSTLFTMIVSDTVGSICKKYDTITVNKTIYDTITIKNNVYDTILKISLKLTTGLNSNQYASISIFPNPTSNALLLETTDVQAFSGYKYQITDAQGKLVYNQFITAAKTEISMKSLGASGIYVLRILDGKGVSIKENKIVLAD